MNTLKLYHFKNSTFQHLEETDIQIPKKSEVTIQSPLYTIVKSLFNDGDIKSIQVDFNDGSSGLFIREMKEG